MKQILPTLAVVFFLTGNAFGQKISETDFSLGVKLTSSPEQQTYWNENPPPTYFTASASKVWYRDNRRISFEKELGLQLQYAGIDLDSGGNGGHSWHTGNIFSLFAEASLAARYRIEKTLVLSIGPEAEMLLIGKNNMNISYYMSFCNPPISGEKQEVGLNRDYFDKPSFGGKLGLHKTMPNENITIGFKFSYLWTPMESSNFYAAHYARVSFFVGFKGLKKQQNQVKQSTQD